MKIYKVITPAGCIIRFTQREAQVYKDLYGYPYVTIDKQSKKKDNES